MIDFIAKLFAGIVYFFIFGGIIFFGISAIAYDLHFIGSLCTVIGLGGLFSIFKMHINDNKRKHQEIVRHFYKLPPSIDHEYGEVWDDKFQKVIKNAINTCKEAEKRTDLQKCQRVAKSMIKSSDSYYTLDCPFYKINKAFRLTGCHLTITDSQGNTIIKIV